MFTAKEVEECILVIVAMLGDKAYPGKITAELSGRASRTVPVAAVHSILHRFEQEGVLISSSVKTELKSRRKRIYTLTEYGRKVKSIPYLPETLKELLRLHQVSDHKAKSTIYIKH
jgi:DNA-binding PadR family transcriptional regulator